MKTKWMRELQMNDDVILFGCFRLFVAEGLFEQSPVKLSGRALDTLIALVEDAGKIVAKRDTPDWGYHLLSEQERTVLRRLAIFDGIFTPEAARLVAPSDGVDEDVTAAASLISKSLIAADGSDTTARLRLIDAMRTYVAEKLTDFDGGDQMAQRHAIYNLQVLEQANAPAAAPLADKRSRAAATHLDNIRSALEWASSERGDNAVGAALAAAGRALAKDPEIAEELGDLHNQLRQVDTALREAERQHLDAQMQLAHANRIATMGQLAASIVHEVNQPIGATLLNAQTALRWLSTSPPNLDSARQSINRIITDGKRVTDIIGLIHDLAKKAPARKKGLEINEVIFEVIGLTRSELSKNLVSFQTRLAHGLPSIWGDRVQLQQVIFNLILNAMEAMSEVSEGSRELVISTRRADSDAVLVAVRDSGPGLSHTSPERLFEAFYTTKPGGLGMGLSICRSIVEAHGGRLWATPNEPRGAVFCMMLPVKEGSLENL
jgi:C4-dicarboxylate-specific signal transduction histidine kinase